MKIFISYRHSEAVAAAAQLIHDGLKRHCQPTRIFFDSDYLKVADTFPAVIEDHLSTCDVFIVLIDPHWVATLDRLKEPSDWVRREIEPTLRRAAHDGVRVIPVLLHGADMPPQDKLPTSLQALTDLHRPPPLRGTFIEQDIAVLAMHLNGWTEDRMLEWLKARRRAGMAVALGALLIASASMISLFDLLTIDTRLEALTLRLAEAMDTHAPSDRIVLVAIDKTSETQLGRPFDRTWRRDHAALIAKLAAAGASVVAFDIYLNGTSPHDAELFEAASAARGRGTAVVFGRSGDADALQLPPGSAIALGLLCIGEELDWARLAALALRRPQGPAVAALAAGPAAGLAHWGYVPSLAALAVAPGATIRYIDAEHRLILVDHPDGRQSTMPFSRTDTIRMQQACAAAAPGDEVAQHIIRFSPVEAWREPARRRRYQDVLAAAPASLAGAYRGKIVLVGTEFADIREVYRGLGTEQRYGYEIHADAIDTLLQGVSYQPLKALPDFLVTLVMGLIGLAGRFWPRLWADRRRIAFAVAVPLACVAFAAWMGAEFHVLLNSTYHVAAFFFAWLVSGWILHSRGLWNTSRH